MIAGELIVVHTPVLKLALTGLKKYHVINAFGCFKYFQCKVQRF